ncbi:hypothetical protein M8C21_003958 [Ambrosia artemisiifolia]|uniref:Uncharacterized protein n=1 Tax=Ambrosia artemisiifolia TaxID=4212 RepID=A0AAD5CA31_AMBAR|nr:hypothetical protein M8C21_003958 [Ambrosia artemisiifolia]
MLYDDCCKVFVNLMPSGYAKTTGRLEDGR